jgi:hypothetical protein
VDDDIDLYAKSSVFCPTKPSLCLCILSIA